MAEIQGPEVTPAGSYSKLSAENVEYDNTVSGLTAEDAQAAIDENAAAIAAQ